MEVYDGFYDDYSLNDDFVIQALRILFFGLVEEVAYKNGDEMVTSYAVPNAEVVHAIINEIRSVLDDNLRTYESDGESLIVFDRSDLYSRNFQEFSKEILRQCGLLDESSLQNERPSMYYSPTAREALGKTPEDNTSPPPAGNFPPPAEKGGMGELEGLVRKMEGNTQEIERLKKQAEELALVRKGLKEGGYLPSAKVVAQEEDEAQEVVNGKRAMTPPPPSGFRPDMSIAKKLNQLTGCTWLEGGKGSDKPYLYTAESLDFPTAAGENLMVLLGISTDEFNATQHPNDFSVNGGDGLCVYMSTLKKGGDWLTHGAASSIINHEVWQIKEPGRYGSLLAEYTGLVWKITDDGKYFSSEVKHPSGLVEVMGAIYNTIHVACQGAFVAFSAGEFDGMEPVKRFEGFSEKAREVLKKASAIPDKNKGRGV